MGTSHGLALIAMALLTLSCGDETRDVGVGGAGGAGGSAGDGAGASQNGGAGGAGGGATGGVGGDPCACGLGGTAPVCGIDGRNYDAICGEECVPVEIGCTGPCPCTG